jgi:hypothetical protein
MWALSNAQCKPVFDRDLEAPAGPLIFATIGAVPRARLQQPEHRQAATLAREWGKAPEKGEFPPGLASPVLGVPRASRRLRHPIRGRLPFRRKMLLIFCRALGVLVKEQWRRKLLERGAHRSSALVDAGVADCFACGFLLAFVKPPCGTGASSSAYRS